MAHDVTATPDPAGTTPTPPTATDHGEDCKGAGILVIGGRDQVIEATPPAH